jgi:hypothetical protein
MMRGIVMINRILILCIISLTIFNCSTDVADSGSGSEAGNAIVGKTVDKSGNPVDYALITLKEKSDLIIFDNTGSTFDTTVFTNSKGEYAFAVPDSGMYYITVEKYDRLLSFIDSIHVKDTDSISIETDTIQAPGSFTGTVWLNDTGVINKNIRVFCTDMYDLEDTAAHGEAFIFTNLPIGIYNFKAVAISDSFSVQSFRVSISSDTLIDIGPVRLEKTEYQLLSSNVMTAEFQGLTDVAVDIVPEYTFSEAPAYAVVRALIYPEIIEISVETEIDRNSVLLKHEEDFPTGKSIGVSLYIEFTNGEQAVINFSDRPENRFTTAN